MNKKRKSYSAEFKTKVVLELLRKEESATANASRYSITVHIVKSEEEKIP